MISSRQISLFKSAAFRISPADKGPSINSLWIPWQGVDVMTSNCPIHSGVRMSRINDEAYECPIDKRVFSPKGSITNQSNRDSWYLGQVIKGPSIQQNPGKA